MVNLQLYHLFALLSSKNDQKIEIVENRVTLAQRYHSCGALREWSTEHERNFSHFLATKQLIGMAHIAFMVDE